jgi:transglutaminase-like putative cysteine protease
MRLLSAVQRANRPGPPENSVTLRVACAGAVVAGIAACHAEGELSWTVTAGSIVLVLAGMALSYRTRARPLPFVKPVLAAAAVVAFVWFFRQLTGQAIYDVSTVENPLAVLFVWVQVAHAFDVPARRDLSFSLAGSASLMAVAAAQATDISFGSYVLAWLTFGIVGLLAMWSSASEGGRMGRRGLVATFATVAVAGCAVLIALPAPHVAGRVDFPANAGSGQQLPIPGALAGDGRVAQLAKPGSPAGRSRVGGYLGFANRLDTALRGDLGTTVVMRVRAQRPSYWIGETFNDWDGANWNAKTPHSHRLTTGSPFVLAEPPLPPGSPVVPETDLQTFYIVQPSPNLVFHADTAHEVWFPSGELFTSDAGTIVSPIGLGPGAIYTVQSDIDTPTPQQLRATGDDGNGNDSAQAQYLELPHTYPRVTALARSLTAGSPDTYDKVERLISWIGAHTRYSTDIPPLAPGQDTVDEFLFGNRTGFCEQISTSLAVMLRSIGIPAREAVGYVPGPYNPITDLYDIQAQDAHAWVQVYFPGFGWQSFDPTAVVPLANPSPGSTLLHEAAGVLRRLPWIPIGAVLVAVGAGVVVTRRRRNRPATWAELAARRMEHAGRRAGRPRYAGETLAEYAGALDVVGRDPSGSWRALAVVIEASAYGGRQPDDADRLLRAIEALRRQLPRPSRWPRRTRRNPAGRPASLPEARRRSASDSERLADAQEPVAAGVSVRPGAVSPIGGRGPRRSSPPPPAEGDTP